MKRPFANLFFFLLLGWTATQVPFEGVSYAIVALVGLATLGYFLYAERS